MAKMNANGLLKFESVQYWMRSLRTEGNRRKCLKSFPRFINWLRKNVDPQVDPDQIIASRIEDLRLPHEDPSKWRWEDLAKQFYHYYYDKYEEEGKSTLSALTWLTAVQSFFAHHRLDLKFRKGELKVAEAKREKRVPLLEEIRSMYEAAERWRDKALLLVLSQSGVSEVDVENMNVEHVVDKLAKPPVYYKRRRTKTRHKGGLIQTCIGPEACEAIAMMLKLRDNPREGPLFITHKGARMSVRIINMVIKKLARDGEVNDGFQTKDLRDFYGDALDHAGIAGKVKQVMMGRVPWGAEKHYKTSKYTIIDAYTKTYQYLKINAQARPKEQLEQVAIEIGRLMEIMTADNPRVKLAEYVDELRGISPSIVGPTSFRELLKRALKIE